MKKWRVALVLPQARWVLEARLRKLALDANGFIILHSAFFIQKFGAVAGNRTRTCSLAKSYSAIKSQPLEEVES